ncbi:hypothetical protein AJ85_17590 [Alkalihalobacillus alcalophilus ATCC 27647 = CGMCC 1.3604]|uniref:Uncharacterized protein n=1 Tax=Alkalihalobacillus alcalophilus ATCC 27647 = CGMCC 1.3604 TaxID=1218173 RepID=A0A4V6S0P8_ALKAL|nr:hypothetical protein [Alkalihalobacillus alcalophilus]MED1563017.1 hypothetical protein [Alkalihalobacillus alcalophilus]THG89452.1 hypothetical protein AJ85_17590 [Alkalihalobacillus alcalophilus ATCC 27647 = CGMCC 1.3604]
MLEWLEPFLQLLVLVATIFSSITLGLKNIKEIRDKAKEKTKKKRRFL